MSKMGTEIASGLWSMAKASFSKTKVHLALACEAATVKQWDKDATTISGSAGSMAKSRGMCLRYRVDCSKLFCLADIKYQPPKLNI